MNEPMDPKHRRTPPKSPSRAGDLGAIKPSRDVILEAAGITNEDKASAARRSWDRKCQLLSATKTQYFSFQGEVRDEREVADNTTQLAASEAIDRLLGLAAPKDSQKVEVVYRVELPDWATPDGATPQVIEVKGETVEGASDHDNAQQRITPEQDR